MNAFVRTAWHAFRCHLRFKNLQETVMQPSSNQSRPSHFRAVAMVAAACHCLLTLPAQAQVPPPPNVVPGLPAPMTNSSSGAIINTVPATPRITDPVPAPAPIVPPVVVNPAAGVVPVAPGATGPVLRPEIGRSNLDAVQTTPLPSASKNPANNATNSLSPAEAAQRQLMIEREDRMRGLNKQQP